MVAGPAKLGTAQSRRIGLGGLERARRRRLQMLAGVRLWVAGSITALLRANGGCRAGQAERPGNRVAPSGLRVCLLRLVPLHVEELQLRLDGTAKQDVLRRAGVEGIHSRLGRTVAIIEEHDVDALHRMLRGALLLVKSSRLVEDGRKPRGLLEALRGYQPSIVFGQDRVRSRIE